MWIRRQMFEGLISTRAMAEGEARTLAEQNKVLQANMDWMRMRISQVEKINAQFLYNISGVKVPVPEIVQAAPAQAIGENHPFNKLPSFEDVGDQQASEMGIKVNRDGTITYA